MPIKWSFDRQCLPGSVYCCTVACTRNSPALNVSYLCQNAWPNYENTHVNCLIFLSGSFACKSFLVSCDRVLRNQSKLSRTVWLFNIQLLLQVFR